MNAKAMFEELRQGEGVKRRKETAFSEYKSWKENRTYPKQLQIGDREEANREEVDDWERIDWTSDERGKWL